MIAFPQDPRDPQIGVLGEKILTCFNLLEGKRICISTNEREVAKMILYYRRAIAELRGGTDETLIKLFT